MNPPTEEQGLYVLPARSGGVLVVDLTSLAVQNVTLSAGGYWTLVADGCDVAFLTGASVGATPDPDPAAVAGTGRCDKLLNGGRLDQWFADGELVIKAVTTALISPATAGYLRLVKSMPPRGV